MATEFGNADSPTEIDNKVPTLRELVVCSLEPWDEIWRRNQFFVDASATPEPGPAGPLRGAPGRRALRPRAAPTTLPATLPPRLRRRPPEAFRPLKPLPRRLGSVADELLLRQVRFAIRVSRFRAPDVVDQ